MHFIYSTDGWMAYAWVLVVHRHSRALMCLWVSLLGCVWSHASVASDPHRCRYVLSLPSVFRSCTPPPNLHCLSIHDRRPNLLIWSGGASSLKGTDVLVGGFAWSCAVAGSCTHLPLPATLRVDVAVGLSLVHTTTHSALSIHPRSPSQSTDMVWWCIVTQGH